MGGTRPSLTLRTALASAVIAALTALSACGTVEHLKGPDIGASNDKQAANMAPSDPLARPTQVAWTSARASYCGFIFNPQQLRSDYLNWEAQAGHTPNEMKKIVKAYDYTLDSVMATIKDKANYCNKDRTDAIRVDLKRYLSGDYTPSARAAR
jgi:hypothetical protein